MTDPIYQFKDAIAAAGLTAPEIIETDGILHRFSSNGKAGDMAGWYIFHGGDIPAGAFGCWRLGVNQTWRADVGRTLTPAEEAAHKERIAAIQKQRKEEEAARRVEAAAKATERWETAAPASPEHPYLVRKGVKPFGLKEHDGNLIIPLRIGSDIHSLQTIYPEKQSWGSDKKLLAGGRKTGCYYSMGNPTLSDVLCLVEGFATGASVREATGYAVAVAFDAGNLLPVAKAMRERFPDMTIIICADDDYRTEGNPGITKATEAAREINGITALPGFDESRPDGATDFNDLHQHKGLEAVKEAITQAIELAAVYGTNDEAAETPPGLTIEALAEKVAAPKKKRELKPGQYAFANGFFEVSEKGLTYTERDKDGNETTQWICSRLEILAMTRDEQSGDWGRLLQWHDRDSQPHRWAMPMEMLQGDGIDFRRELARGGLEISPGQKARNLLTTYIQVCKVENRARCVDRMGWHGDVYVTPHEAIGQSDEIVVFQNVSATEPAFAQSGTVTAWRDTIARLARGNSRLMFALSVSFAAALAEIAGEDSGGFHFRGGSSSGKTTALHVAASVWGRPSSYTRLWRATANGLEGLAAVHNDGLLILDELSQIDPREAGAAAYLLANGQGKTRASRTGAARKAPSWRLLFLSSGEESLAALMARSGTRANAGQEIRLADIESDAGKGMGIFEALHEYQTPAALSVALKDTASKLHGAVGLEWLRRIAADRQNLPGVITDGIRQFVERYAPPESSGQVQRVASRFALAAVAGEIARHYGLTGWEEGETSQAAGQCFTAWLEGFGGTGNKEERAILSQVKAFFEAHGASRFENDKATEDQRIISRAGFYRYSPEGEREYLVLPEAFSREVCTGYDKKTVEKILLANGWIEPSGDGRATQKPRIASLGKPTRCYIFTSQMWEGEQ